MTPVTAAPQSRGGQQPLGSQPFGRFLMHAISQVKGLYLVVALTWTVIYGLPLVIGLAVSRLIDRAGTGRVDSATWWLLVVAVVLMAVRAVVLWGGLQLTFVLIFKTSAWLKIRVLRGLLSRPAARDKGVSNGETINRLRDDTEEIGGLLEWTTDVFYRSLLLVVAVTVLASTDLIMTIPLVLLLGGLFASVYLKNRVADLQTQTRVEQGRIGGAITDTLTGIRDLRLSGAITGRMARLERGFAGRRSLQRRHQVFSDLLADLFQNLVMIGIAVVLLTAVVQITAGEFTIGELVLFITYSSWLGQQMSFYGKVFARYQGGKVSYQRLAETSDGIEAAPAADVLAEPLRELTVRGLTRAAPDGGSAPEPVDFTVRPGELVAIAGPIGAGKSTVVRAMLGSQADGEGEVHWNGTVVTGDRNRLGAPRISYARQSPRFVTGTVRDNLRVGDDSITEECMIRALTAVHLSPGSPGLSEGLDTFIDSGEASRLSGGQRQRLALARMLCRSAEVYIVDDCDSSLDGPTARDIWETVPRDWPGAWVVVSHNQDLLARADTVVRVSRRAEASVATTGRVSS
ncbi:ATP-binding cassette domain-containing protein [Streptomyces sp. NRRL F-5053]|uniref:ATP-binding cassette domain-containing protein n=1 Tax=Streptomyces sp. NRRL F-5053 TaxID=1463854 RepID=UPI001331A706|nr:ABC transporter ATP-binding protein [Streptomyces sp. NRRL F-5053]